MNVVISEEVLDSAEMTPDEMRTEIALLLYAQGRLSLGKCAELAGIGPVEFQRLVASRGLTVSYDEAAFEKDLKTMERLRGR